MKNSRTIYSIMFTGKMILFAFLLSACGGYYSNLPADGIYATRTIEINHSETPRQNKSNYYKNYFNNLSQQESLPHSSDPIVHQDSIITDIEGYSQYDESYPETQTYQSNAPWGKNSSTTKIIIRDYSYPVYFGYGLFQRPWRLGFRPFGHRYYGHFYDPYYDAGFYGSYYGYGRFYDPYTYNPYYGYGGFYSPYSYPPYYGYGGYWVSRRFRSWDTYSYGDWDNSPGYNRFYRKEGYSGVSFSRGRRGEGGVTTGRTNSKSRKEIKEPNNNRSSVKNDLSTRIIMARLQAGRNSSGIYNGTTDPQLTRSYSSGSSQVRSTSKVPAGVKSSSRSSSGKISSTRQGRTESNQRKISPRTPDYQLSRQSGSSSINSKSKVENPRYKVQSSHSSSGRNSSSSSNTRPSSNNQYRKSASGVTNRNQSTGYSNSSNRYSTPSRTTQVQKSTYRSPSRTTSSRSSNKTVSKSSQTYQNKTSQKSYQPRNSSYNSSRNSSSQTRSQPTRSSYSSSRSSSSNSRGRSSSSGRRN
ncbi:MAG: hypothetical protein OXC03_09015 [Flavobacteriaceae bacterium]|nr:hypothetical protein [Flavobacteriaceae bacterium]